MGMGTAAGPKIYLGISWDHNKKRRVVGAAIAFLTVAFFVAAPAPVSAADDVDVIVQHAPGNGGLAEDVVVRSGGALTSRFVALDSFAASVPASAVDALRQAAAVESVSYDSALTLLSLTDVAPAAATSMSDVLTITGADQLHAKGITGAGVDVAIIDSGIAPVSAMPADQVINGADLSLESQDKHLMHLDTYGHGTHLAGIIAGDGAGFTGMAPDARLLNVKVSTADGAVDVSQILAAIDWVVQHRNDNGLNVRVLNLAFGTDGSADHRSSVLSYAVEVAWRNGIVVVVAGGNDTADNKLLRDPARSPFVIAVGAADTNGTVDPTDDVVASFSSCGNNGRGIDLVAPGRSIASLRVPGGNADISYPLARVGDELFLGSGSSQATAVVSGAAALMLSQRPELTNDQVKQMLMDAAMPVPGEARCTGAGLVDVAAAADAPVADVTQEHPSAKGGGKIDDARGSQILYLDGVALVGDQDIHGARFASKTWAKVAAAGTSWSGGSWNGTEWTGNSWSGNSWSGNSWSGNSWSGNSWSGNSWSGNSWSGNSWSGNSWSGNSWSGDSWSSFFFG